MPSEHAQRKVYTVQCGGCDGAMVVGFETKLLLHAVSPNGSCFLLEDGSKYCELLAATKELNI